MAMNKIEAVQKAKYKHKKIVASYQDADDAVWVNQEDKDLIPIKIPMPEVPDWRLIDGYGLKPEEQYFKMEEKPRRLKTIEDRLWRDLEEQYNKKPRDFKKNIFGDEMIKILESDPQEYAKEIKWLKRQWYHRIYGYWFFNNGKPTYLCGWNWSFLNYCKMKSEKSNNGYPQFRIRDMKWFHAQWFLFNDTTVPEKDESGDVKFNEDGSVKVIDVGYPTCLGTNNLKGRRVGDTTKAEWIHLEIVTMDKEQHGGIQGDTETTAGNIYLKHFKYPLEHIPWYFRPKYKFRVDKVIFEDTDGGGLGSWTDFATTAHRNFYDSTALQFYHGDELGKTKNEDVVERHNTVRLCVLPPGGHRVGFIIYTTTVEHIGESANKFYELTKSSMYEERHGIGYTTSGLINVFFPATESASDYIDRFGYAVIDDDEARLSELRHPRKINGEKVGALKYFLSERETHIKNGNWEALASEKRKNPLSFRECFIPPAENQFWNVGIVEQRKQYLEFDHPEEMPVMGNFEWRNGFGSPVKFIPDEKGRFEVMIELKPLEANQFVRKNGTVYPKNTHKFVSSADPFRVDQTNGNRFSDGGGATRWMYDEEVDKDNEIGSWRSSTWACTYQFRPPSRNEYAEDMLKMCIYYGSGMYPENNVDVVIDKFREWGYEGFLIYDIDSRTLRKKPKPGFSTQGTNKSKLFELFASDIKKHGHRYRSIGLINDCIQIKGMKDMTDYDRWTAAAGCLMAEESKYNKLISMKASQTVELSLFGIDGRRK